MTLDTEQEHYILANNSVVSTLSRYAHVFWGEYDKYTKEGREWLETRRKQLQEEFPNTSVIWLKTKPTDGPQFVIIDDELFKKEINVQEHKILVLH